MSRIIRLTESQLHNLIVEALLESAMETDWRFPFHEAQKLLYQSQNVDNESEEYVALWNKYCNLIKMAQERFKDKYNAKHDYDVKLKKDVIEFIEKGYKTPMGFHDERWRFLFRPLVYLTPYEEMNNYNPNIKYMNFVKIGGLNATLSHQSRRARAICDVVRDKNKEWDLFNYTLMDKNRPNNASQYKFLSRTEDTPKNQGGVEIDDMVRARCYVQPGEAEDNAQWMDRNSQGYNEDFAKPFWTNALGQGYWNMQNSKNYTKRNTDNNISKFGGDRLLLSKPI